MIIILDTFIIVMLFILPGYSKSCFIKKLHFIRIGTLVLLRISMLRDYFLQFSVDYGILLCIKIKYTFLLLVVLYNLISNTKLNIWYLIVFPYILKKKIKEKNKHNRKTKTKQISKWFFKLYFKFSPWSLST